MFKQKNIQQSNVTEGQDDILNDDGDDDYTTIQKNSLNKKKAQSNNHDLDIQKDAIKKHVQEEMQELNQKACNELLGSHRELSTAEIYPQQKDIRSLVQKKLELVQELKQTQQDKNRLIKLSNQANIPQQSEKDLSNYKINGTLGPLPAPTNLRATCRFDFHPSLCKDYHDTGSCVFGDSCLYLHDRGDYQTGWELEQEWEKEQLEKRNILMNGKKYNRELDEIKTELEQVEVPKACPICNKRLKAPIITPCSHFFCEKCALAQYQQSQKCFTCGKLTEGRFNDAVKEIAKIRVKRNEVKQQYKQDEKFQTDEAIQEILTSDDDDDLDD